MPASAYDEIAEWYDESVRSPSSRASQVAEHLVSLCSVVRGQQFCDLACGQGLVARRLAREGARVTGLDLSPRLLEMAREYEQAEPLGIQYRCADAQSLHGIEDASFDSVVCNLALMDIPDLAATFRAVRRVLRPLACFVFSITHPCFQMPRSPQPGSEAGGQEVCDGYFREGFWRSDYPHGVRGRVGAYHRTLGTYLNTLAGAPLILEQFVEMRPEGEATGSAAVPKFLIARGRKEGE